MTKTSNTATHPTHSTTGITIPTKLAEALMQFACQDTTRFHMSGLGLDDEANLSATDGHTMARVLTCDPGGTQPMTRAQACWEGSYVTTQIKVAKATKSATIELAWDKLISAQFPPCSKVSPTKRAVKSAFGFNPRYLARLVKVAEALGSSKRDMRGVKLVSATAELDPVVFECENGDGVKVEVVVMPMRMS